MKYQIYGALIRVLEYLAQRWGKIKLYSKCKYDLTKQYLKEDQNEQAVSK